MKVYRYIYPSVASLALRPRSACTLPLSFPAAIVPRRVTPTFQYARASAASNAASPFAVSDMVQSMLHRDLSFALWEIFDLGKMLDERDRFKDLDKASSEQFLQTASNIALEKFANHFRKNDQAIGSRDHGQ